MYKLKAIKCKSALHKLKRNLPYDYDLNIFKGCSHNCIYCYARYTRKFSPAPDNERIIYAKVNLLEHLERELHAFGNQRHVINMGGATDAYQEAEKTAKLMRGVLELMIRFKNPIVICTKSDLVLRDMDLIEELASLTDVNIAASISTVDEFLASKLEPGASPPANRLEMIHQFSLKTNAMTGVHFFPVIPLITDGYNQIEDVFEMVSRAEPDYVLMGSLYLRGETLPYYMNQIKKHFPEHYSQSMRLYQSGKLDGTYKKEMYKRINSVKDKYKFKLTSEQAIERLRTGQIML